MKVRPDELDRHLARALASAYLISGDEPLGVAEAADAVRARARAEGFTERDVHFIERGTSWADIRAAASTMSLFASRRLLELRLGSSKPGVEGGAVIAELAKRRDPDTLLLILCDRLDRSAQGAAWVRAVEAEGVMVTVWPVDAARMPAWVRGRARRLGFECDEAAARLLAERTEGNLLAAHQELERLRLVLGGGRLGEDEVAGSVADSARYDVFRLGEAALAGERSRALRIVAGLQAEGVEPTLVLWVLLRELRAAGARIMGGGGGGGGGVARGGYMRPTPGLDQAVRRLRRDDFPLLVERASRADRMIKGQLRGNAWDEIALLAAEMCGVTALRAAMSGARAT